MFDSVWPHRRQPTRLPHPWDSPGKNTAVGCHFLLQCMKVKVKLLVMSDPQRPRGLQPSRLLRPWDYPDKCAGVGCHCLLHASYYRIIIHLCYKSLVSLQAFLLMITFQRKWFLLCGIHFGVAMRLVVTRFFIKCSCVHGPMLVWVYKIDMVSKVAEWIVETI